MQVNVEDLGPVEKRVLVEIPWEDVKPKIDEAYKEIVSQVAIKGFRKGHVPRPILEKMFGPRLGKEMARQLVEETFPKAMEEKGLHPVAEPVVEDDGIRQGQAFQYRARVEVAPEIVPKDYDNVPLVRRTPKVTDAMVAQALERRREDVAEYRTIAGRKTYAPGDVILCDLMGKVGDKPFSVDSVHIEVGTPERERLAGLGHTLVGVSIDDKEIDVAFTLSADHKDETLRAAKVHLLVTVHEAREKHLPALDDDFAKETGEADTLEDLRTLARQRLETAAQTIANRELRNGLVTALVARNPFEISQTLVDRRLDSVMARLRVDLARQGVDLKHLPAEEENLRTAARAGAAETVRQSLLVEAIARREGIEVTEADVEKRLSEIAVAQGRGENVARVRADLEKDGRLGAVRLALREEKTLDLLISKATITEEEIATDSLVEPSQEGHPQ